MRTFVILCVIAVAMAAPLPPYERALNSDCVSVPTTGLDGTLFPSQYMLQGDESSSTQYSTEVKSALGFSVEYYPQYKVVVNNIANETYVLYQCGSQEPPASEFPEGTKFFKVPLTAVSVPETVPYAFLELLGVDDRVQGVSPYSTSACGQKMLACERTAPDAMQLSNTTLLESTAGPFADGVIASAAQPYDKTFSFNGAQEPGVLSNAEWIKFLGLFFNREKYAGDVYDGIVQEYEATKAAAAEADASDDGFDTPVVAFAEYFDYEDDESYILSFAPYKEQLVEDAGGKMIDFETVSKIKGVRPTAYTNTSLEFAWAGEGAKFTTKEEARAAFLNVLQDADVVVDSTYAVGPADYGYQAFLNTYGLTDPAVTADVDLPWLESKRIFRIDGLISAQNGSDWFEGAYVRPDKVLADIVRLVDSAREFSTAPTPKNFTWIRNIEEAPRVITEESCKRLEGCSSNPVPICPFVSVCPDGTTTLLRETDNDLCEYEDCASNALTGNTGDMATNTAQMAAPAVILLTVLIVFVEALINFC